MNAKKLASLAILLARFTAVRAAHAYRPFDETDADVAALGEFELELGPVGYLRADHQSSIVAPNVVLNFGIVSRWELVIQGLGLFPSSGSPAFENGGVFLKHVLREGSLQGKTGISLATEFGVLVPSYTQSAWSDSGLAVSIIASQAWRDLAVHLNVSLSRAVDAQNDFLVGAIVEGVPRARIRPVAELYVDAHGDVITPSVLVGFIVRANQHFSFDAATRVASSTFEARAGLTWTL